MICTGSPDAASVPFGVALPVATAAPAEFRSAQSCGVVASVTSVACLGRPGT